MKKILVTTALGLFFSFIYVNAQDIIVKNGLKQEDAKKVTKLIKDSGLKVQTQIMDDIIRVTGKKIDDLQDVIKLIRENELGFPTQFENMKS